MATGLDYFKHKMGQIAYEKGGLLFYEFDFFHFLWLAGALLKLAILSGIEK